MLFHSVLLAAFATAATATHGNGITVPSLQVPQCPSVGTASYDWSVPDKTPFPLTKVDLCYDTTSIHLTFKAYKETNYYYNASQGTNDDIWEYEVMETFIYHGTNDPQTYLEFEVNPNNVTYQAFVYNPSKVRATGAPFDHFFVTDPATDGFSATTTLDRSAQTWFSDVTIPLALFNVVEIKGSQWRMNFFRTITSPSTYPNQTLGAWSPPSQANFHMTPYFGNILFV